MNTLISITGWAGSVVLVVAYWINIKGGFTAQSAIYQWMNVVGSFCLIINSTYHGAYPSSMVNIIWAAIGITYATKIKASTISK